MWPGQHEDWASSPVTLVPGGKKGEQLADAMSTRINLSALLLKDENSLLTSGTGIAIADHVALSGGYIWKNIHINKGFHPGRAQSCEAKNEREHTSV